MKGIQCDRCGEFYSYGFNNPIEGYKISGSEPYSDFGFDVDLCSKCYREIKQIITSKKTEQKPNTRQGKR